ncbi:MAG: alpha/beta hydrolase [Planctomycetota bacterium]|nr:MAG: alpha/beta hydrolase [Planctomycetota bacterium]
MNSSTTPWTLQRRKVGSLYLHCAEAGQGPLLILLHGFPEFWYGWRHQIGPLAEAGYRVVAPDLRGYNLSDKPKALEAYRGEALAGDVANLIESYGEDKAYVVGHDWGGGVAFAAAYFHPEKVDRLVILNSPHPLAFQRALRGWKQRCKSWYMLAFQLPWLPEWSLASFGYRSLRRLFHRDPMQPFSKQDIQAYVDALAQPGARRGALAYYRASFRWPLVPGKLLAKPLPMPTLLLWGMQDQYLGSELTEDLEAWIPDLQIRRFDQASHWLAHDQPEQVNRALLKFLAKDDPSRG